jgi:uncharacterized protein YceK
MKSIRNLTLLLSILVLLSGCFQVHRTIILKKDGSGTIEENFLVTTEMGKNMGGQSLHDVEKLKADAVTFGENVSYVSSEEIEENGLKGYIAVYAFDDITKLSLDTNLAARAMQGSGMAAEKEIITFNFEKGKTSQLTIIFPPKPDEPTGEEYLEETSEPLSEEDQQQSIEMVKAMYAGMKLSFKIKFDGKITDSNAMFVDGNVVTISEMDFDKMMTNDEYMKIFSSSDNVSEKEMKEKMQNAPGFKNEMNEKITVEFK